MFPPIVMLHHVDNSPHPTIKPWCVSKAKFIELLDYLDQEEFRTTTFEEIAQSQSRINGNTRKVILTFDDCSRRLMDFAVPELERRKMKASFYMPTAYIGQHNAWDYKHGITRVELMSEDDLKCLKTLGMEVASHSHTHTRLTNMSIKEAEREIKESKLILETLLQCKVYSFSYPHGAVPKRFKTVFSSNGYMFGLSIHQPLQSIVALRRVPFLQSDSQLTLKHKLSRKYSLHRSIYDNVAHVKGTVSDLIKRIGPSQPSVCNEL